ncbi:septal ring lytic transglycosylase RlpA family protein [Colwelliaceae bacterium BS250]
MTSLKNICLLALICTLFACTSNNSRYSQKHDSIPTRLPSQSELKEPVPRVETPSRGGNKHYQVFGIPYKVLPTAEGYVETGTASWYGNKFHGHLTSNGETYDMYAFSAAHKSLPLPTYLRVTNLANNKSVIVRANDRGPFHQDRLIDLSYSAAYKLGYLKQGTAKVKVEAITATNLAKFTQPQVGSNDVIVSPYQQQSLEKETTTVAKASTVIAKPVTTKAIWIKPATVKLTTPASYSKFIHVLVTRDKLLADNTAKGLKFLMQVPVELTEKNELFRVQVGPIDNANQAKKLLANIHQQGYVEAYPLKSLK